MSDLLDDLNNSEASELQAPAQQYLKPSSSISLLLSLLANLPALFYFLIFLGIGFVYTESLLLAIPALLVLFFLGSISWASWRLKIAIRQEDQGLIAHYNVLQWRMLGILSLSSILLLLGSGLFFTFLTLRYSEEATIQPATEQPMEVRADTFANPPNSVVQDSL